MRFLCFFLFSAVSFAGSLQVKTLLPLHSQEAQITQVWHGGYLWEGDAASQSVVVFRSDGTKVLSIPIPHFIKFLFVGDSESVLVEGKNDDMESFLSKISVRDFKVKTKKLSEPVFSLSLLADEKGKVFFGDIPEKHLATLQGSVIQRFGPEISAPTHLARIQNEIWVVESFGVGALNANVVKVNTLTGVGQRIFSDSEMPGNLYRLFAIPEKGWIIASESKSSRLLVLEGTQLINSVSLSGNPRALSRLGHCLVALSETSRVVHFLDMTKGFQSVASWDISDSPFQQPQGLEVDPVTGRLFVRSSIPCMGCSVSPNGVLMVEEPSRATWNQCTNALQGVN